MVRLLRVHVRDEEHGGRVPRRRRTPAALRCLHAGGIVDRGGKRPASLRAAAAVSAGEHRREVGVAERVEVGRRELHRPASLGTSSRFRSWHVEPVPELSRITEAGGRQLRLEGNRAEGTLS
jgi:hypothetical protein